MNFLIEGHFIAPLSNEIQKEYNKLSNLISPISTALRTLKKIDGTGGKVTIADIIAYHIGWGKLIINWYEIGTQGKIAEMPGEGFTKWDYAGLARHFYKKYCYDSFHEQERIFYDVVQQVLSIVEREYNTNNLDKLEVWPWCTLPSGKQWSLHKWITVNTVAPYKRTSTLIKKFINENKNTQ